MWSELPYHLLELIIDKLLMTTSITDDYIRFGAVCTSWREVFIRHSHPHLVLCHRLGLPPFLLVPNRPPPSSSSKKKKKNKNTTMSLSYYNIIHKKVYNQFQLTISSDTHFRGSSYGWLVAVDDQGDYDCQIRLFNPFTNNNILLPSMKNLSKDSSTHASYLRKAVLSDDPLLNPTDYIVMAIFGDYGKLAFYKPGGCGDGDEKWTLVEIESYKLSSDKYSHEFHDVIYDEDEEMFMAINVYGVVLYFDATLNMKLVGQTSPPPRPQSPLLLPALVYLSSGLEHLLQVQRFMQLGKYDHVTKTQHYKTSKFRVLMYRKTSEEEGTNRYQWMDTKSIGKLTLFLGNSATMCIYGPPGCKPNSIYFAMKDHDLGIFNLEDETIENHYPTDNHTPIWPIPIWIQPGIYKREGGGEGINSV